MKTRSPRSSFHHAVVTRSGARRSTSRANDSAQRRTSGNDQFGSMRQAMWIPRLLQVCTVIVMGDNRNYDSVCALRAVTSTDGMTADIYPFDADFLSRVATRIVNEVRGINRVVYDYTSKPPGTIEWE